MWEGGCGQDGVEWGGKWDNCNSIINKYIKKKKKGHLYKFNNKDNYLWCSFKSFNEYHKKLINSALKKNKTKTIISSSLKLNKIQIQSKSF